MHDNDTPQRMTDLLAAATAESDLAAAHEDAASVAAGSDAMDQPGSETTWQSGPRGFLGRMALGAAAGGKGLAEGARRLHERGAPVARAAATRVGSLTSSAVDTVRDRLAPTDNLELFGRDVTPLGDPTGRNDAPPITAITGVALAGASVGAFANATELMRFTRPLMDADNVALQRWLSDVFPAATNPLVSRAMDTVPGAEYAGGMFHRLHHGHDIEGLVAMVREFGFDGAASWINHVGLRDLWTPHGVPWLPAGAGDVHAWLVELGMQRSLAATLLSVNAATLAGLTLGLLAGVAFRQYVRTTLERAEAKSRFDHACAALNTGDLITATERFESALRLPGANERLRLAAAMASLEAARHSDHPETRARVARDASYWLKDILADPKARVSGTSMPAWAGADVSTHALAAVLYSQALMLAYGDDATATIEIDRMRTGVAAAIDHGDRLLDPPRRGPLARPARPLSAAVNYTLALETVLAYPQRLVTANTTPERLHRSIREALMATAGTEYEELAHSSLQWLEQRLPGRALLASG